MGVEDCDSFGWIASNALHFLPDLDLWMAEMRLMISECDEDEKDDDDQQHRRDRSS